MIFSVDGIDLVQFFRRDVEPEYYCSRDYATMYHLSKCVCHSNPCALCLETNEKSSLLFNLLVLMAVKCPLGGAIAFPLFLFSAMKMRGFIFCFGKSYYLLEENITPKLKAAMLPDILLSNLNS